MSHSHSHAHLSHRRRPTVASTINATVRLAEIRGDAAVLRAAGRAGEVGATKTEEVPS